MKHSRQLFILCSTVFFRFPCIAAPELAAGSKDVLSLTLPYKGSHVIIHQDLLKCQYTFTGRPLQVASIMLVKWNEIDLATNTPEQPDQSVSVLQGIVYA